MAGYIGWMGTRLVRKAASGLMDEQNVEHDRRVHAILDAHVGPNGLPPRICGYHNLRHRQNDRYLWVDFHVNVPGQTTIKDAHALASAIEHEIGRRSAKPMRRRTWRTVRTTGVCTIPQIFRNDRHSKEPSPVELRPLSAARVGSLATWRIRRIDRVRVGREPRNYDVQPGWLAGRRGSRWQDQVQ